MITGKRGREQEEMESIRTMAKCLMLFSHGGHVRGDVVDDRTDAVNGGSSPSRVFECKTCNRQFPSFQALGGHRASHKKPRLQAPATVATADGLGLQSGSASFLRSSQPNKPKTHECSICGLEFAIGQALGGHMRRHRAAATAEVTATTSSSESVRTLSLSPPQSPLMQVKKSNTGGYLCLDLNLAPPSESDLEFQIGKVSPIIHCYL